MKRLNLYLRWETFNGGFYCENYHQFSLIYGAVGVGVCFHQPADGSSLTLCGVANSTEIIFFANSWVQFSLNQPTEDEKCQKMPQIKCFNWERKECEIKVHSIFSTFLSSRSIWEYNAHPGNDAIFWSDSQMVWTNACVHLKRWSLSEIWKFVMTMWTGGEEFWYVGIMWLWGETFVNGTKNYNLLYS